MHACCEGRAQGVLQPTRARDRCLQGPSTLNPRPFAAGYTDEPSADSNATNVYDKPFTTTRSQVLSHTRFAGKTLGYAEDTDGMPIAIAHKFDPGVATWAPFPPPESPLNHIAHTSCVEIGFSTRCSVRNFPKNAETIGEDLSIDKHGTRVTRVGAGFGSKSCAVVGVPFTLLPRELFPPPPAKSNNGRGGGGEVEGRGFDLEATLRDLPKNCLVPTVSFVVAIAAAGRVLRIGGHHMSRTAMIIIPGRVVVCGLMFFSPLCNCAR